MRSLATLRIKKETIVTLILQLVLSLFPIGVATFASGLAHGQNFPNKPIRIITAEPGGGADFITRLVAQGLTANLASRW